MKTALKISFTFAGLLIFLIRCGGTPIPKNPIVELVKDQPNGQVYTVTLTDMDIQGNQYQHKYKIFENAGGKVNIRTTDLINVSDDFFHLHENDLGMEVRSRNKDGKINNLITPPGFTNFIGNPEMGTWQDRYVDTINVTSYTDSTFWVFNDEYRYLENELGLEGLNITRKEHENFQSLYLYNRPYYGEKTAPDSTKYGTRSRHWIHIYPGFYSRRRYKRNFYKSTPYSSSRSRGGGGFGK
ncbi:MAG: hypothetical protein MK066_12170 [Crocinitomicaceae bacterium]|nr:hypothetical protein [Crocinitomicaceae bacterium]